MTPAIATRNLCGMRVPELGIGTAPLGNLYRRVSDAEAQGALAAALAAGMRFADTAPYYGFGLAEKRLGAALHAADAIVSTKVGRLLQPVPPGEIAEDRHGFHSDEPYDPVFDYSHDGVLRAHESSLARLGRDRIDFLLVHDIGRATHGDAHCAMMAQLIEGGGLRALERLRGEGAISGFGIGVNECEVAIELIARAPIDVVLLAGRYTLLEQDALDALLPLCAARGIGVVIGGPYNSGILAGGGAATYNYAAAPAAVVEKARAIEAICRAHEVSLGAAALRFVLAHPAVTSVVPGLASAAEVAETVARYRADIPDALWGALMDADLLRLDAPTPTRMRAEIA